MITELRPEPKKVKTYKAGNVDLRLSSTSQHQDGIAHNPASKTVVLSDGMGGVGRPGETKNNFAFALAHAAAELEDVTSLQNPAVVRGVVARSRSLLSGIGVDAEAPSTATTQLWVLSPGQNKSEGSILRVQLAFDGRLAD